MFSMGRIGNSVHKCRIIVSYSYPVLFVNYPWLTSQLYASYKIDLMIIGDENIVTGDVASFFASQKIYKFFLPNTNVKLLLHTMRQQCCEISFIYSVLE